MFEILHQPDSQEDTFLQVLFFENIHEKNGHWSTSKMTTPVQQAITWPPVRKPKQKRHQKDKTLLIEKQQKGVTVTDRTLCQGYTNTQYKVFH